MSLSKIPDHSFDLLVLDAFSSDAIPTHLLTLEALQLDLSKLALNGLLAIHISNRYLDLEPILGRLASQLHVAALIRADSDVTDEESDQEVLLDLGDLCARRKRSRHFARMNAGPRSTRADLNDSYQIFCVCNNVESQSTQQFKPFQLFNRCARSR
jgi:hypothetical protein